MDDLKGDDDWERATGSRLQVRMLVSLWPVGCHRTIIKSIVLVYQAGLK